MKKKFLLFILTLVTAICLSGCGKEKEKDQEAVNITVDASVENSMEASEAVQKDDAGTKADSKEVSVQSTGSADKSGNDAAAKPSATPKATEKPKATDAPVGTLKPATTEKPGSSTATSKPASTEKPAATAVPTVTATPKPTEQPTATARPTATTAPAATSTPKPTATATPKPTQTPGVAAHTCSWDSGSVTKAASCAEEGVKTYTCTVCGVTKAGSIAMLAHDYQKHYRWGSGPTCTSTAAYFWECSGCGAVNGEWHDDALPHSFEETIIWEATCNEPRIVERTCTVCGFCSGRESYDVDVPHTWETLLVPHLEWSEEAGTMIEVQVEWTHCTVCGMVQE